MVKLSKQVKKPAKSHIFSWLYKPKIISYCMSRNNNKLLQYNIVYNKLLYSIQYNKHTIQ